MRTNHSAMFALTAVSTLALAAPETAVSKPSSLAAPEDVAARIGAASVVPAGEQVAEVVVVLGSARIEGAVDGHVIVVLGSVDIGGAATVGGDLVVVAGAAEVEAGAALLGDVVVVASGLDAPPGTSAATALGMRADGSRGKVSSSSAGFWGAVIGLAMAAALAGMHWCRRKGAPCSSLRRVPDSVLAAARLRLLSAGRCLGVVALAWSSAVGLASAQTDAEPPPEVEAGTESEESAANRTRSSDGVVRIGSAYTVRAGERVREVVVVLGRLTVEGAVDSDVVVVAGSLKIASTGSIGGETVVVGGSAEIEAGADLDQELVVVGGALNAPDGFRARGGQVAIGPGWDGERFAAVAAWLTRGLLWGRPIVPELPGVWYAVALLALMYLLANAVFERPVRACVRVIADKPLSTGLAGVLVLLLIGPLAVILAVSVIGIAVLPVLFCGLFVAGLLGRIGVMRWIGSRVLPESEAGGRLESTRSLGIGLAVVCLAYMVPILGFAAWALLGVFGLGAAAMAFAAGLGRERPSPSAPPSAQPAAAASSLVGGESRPAVGAADPQPPAAADAPASAAAADLSLFPKAGFLNRLGAVLLDIVLVALACSILDLSGSAKFALFLAYHVVFWGWKGTTVGGIVCQLRVVRTDGASLRFSDALIRGLSAIFSVMVVGLGWLWFVWDIHRQAWHDKIAGTYVVRVPSDWPLP